jgi:hypothetical protein
MAFNTRTMKTPEPSIAELERKVAERAKEHAAAQAAHDGKVAEDARHRDAVV